MMFSLRGGGRANNATQGGCNNGNEQGGRADGNTGTMGGPQRTSVGFNDWDDASVRLQGDDPSAPDVDARSGRGGEQTSDNVFALGGGGGRRDDETPRNISATAPPREITQLTQWATPSEGGDEIGDTNTRPAQCIPPERPRHIQDWRWPRQKGASEPQQRYLRS